MPSIFHYLVPPFVHVDLAHPLSVDWVTLVRVDHNDKKARIGVDHLRLVAGLQVPEDRGVIEEGQVDHVLASLKLGWVDPTHLTLRVNHLLVADAHCQFGRQVGALSSNTGDFTSTLKQPLPLQLD